ncbi:hypothetical protein WJX77_010582 [Trebouxia sp. C0004]
MAGMALFPVYSRARLWALLLTTKTFGKLVLESNLPAVVEFYAPWCGHCKALAPQFQKVAENLQGIATVAAVDCDDQSNQPLCGEYNVQGFPTLKIFPASKPKAGSKSKRKLPSDYNGPRTAKGIADALTAALPSTYISKLKDAPSYSNFTTTSSLPKVVLFTDKPKTSALYKSLSLRFKGRLAFAEVTNKASNVVEQQAVEKFPKLIVLDGDKMQEYSGKFKATDLIAFLSEQAGSTASGKANDSEDSEGSNSQQEKKEEKQDPQIVRDLNLTQYEGLTEEEDAWLVGFYSDGGMGSSCSLELREWNKVNFQLSAVTLAGQVNISNAAAGELMQLQEVGVDVQALQKQPCSLQVVLLPFGEKDEPLLFKGNQTAKELQAFAVATFPDIVSRISGSTVDKLFGSTMTHPKVVLFTDKKDTPGVFRALAASFRKYQLLFFTIHSSDAQARKTFSVQKIPTVVLAFLPPGRDEEVKGPTQLQLQPYPGPLKYQYLSAWLTMAASELGLMPEGYEGDSDQPTPPAAEVPEVTTSDAFRKKCLDLTGLCIIAALNPIRDDFASQKATLQAVAATRASSALHYLWLDVTRQGPFWEGLGVGRGDVPTAVAISLKKRRQASLDSGAFTQEGLKTFVEKLVNGKTSTHPLQEVPKVIDGGHEPVPDEPQITEEEFELSDIMGEQLDAQVDTQEERLRQLEKEEEEDTKRQQQEDNSGPVKPKKKKKKSTKGGKKKQQQSTDEL